MSLAQEHRGLSAYTDTDLTSVIHESVKQAPSNRGRRFIPAWLDAERRFCMAEPCHGALSTLMFRRDGSHVRTDKDPTILRRSK
jgi:hypothetical protein